MDNLAVIHGLSTNKQRFLLPVVDNEAAGIKKSSHREPFAYSSTTTNASGPAPHSSHSKSAGNSVWPSGNSYTQSQTVHLIFIMLSSFIY